MPDWTDLKAAIAACSYTSCRVDPLPFSVPDRAADVVPEVDDDDGVPDDEHAARNTAKPLTATMAVAPCLLRRRCIVVLLIDL